VLVIAYFLTHLKSQYISTASSQPSPRLNQIVSEVVPANGFSEFASDASKFSPENSATKPRPSQPLVLNTPHTTVIQSSQPNEVSTRLEKIENLLLNNGNSILAYNLKEKLRKLDNFRANTEVEIAGIREILAELQKEQGQKISATRKTTEEDTGLVTEDMRKIIYRARANL